MKIDHDGEEKRFVYIDAICTVTGGEPKPVNVHESLEWVAVGDLVKYELNPPTQTLLKRLNYIH